MSLLDFTSDRLTIQTGEQTLDGWLTSRVTRGVELCPSHFEITLTERYPGKATTAVVVPGSTCKVYLGGDLVLTGYIDEYSPSYDAHTHNVKISGRSNVEDVVDSTYFPGEDLGLYQITSGQTLKQAVTKILEQFPNVGLNFQGDDPNLPFTYHIPFGETAYSVIETLCRMCSKLLWDDENGDLVISDVGTGRAGSALVEGQNVEAATSRINWAQRFNKLIVASSGQQPGGITVSTLATATDGQIRSTRKKVILMDTDPGPNNDFAKKRAEWELNRRIGRSLMVQVHVVGWRDGGGQLWKPNSVVNVTLPQQKIGSDLVISECSWERSEAGTATILTCMPARALQPQPYIPQAGIGMVSGG